MQLDMHYYATYAMAALAGFPTKCAETIAQAAQWVDDQNSSEAVIYDTGEAIEGTPTAHHPLEAYENALKGGVKDDSRQIWVPFHFLPGAIGESHAEKMICRKDSLVAQDMLAHYLAVPMARNGFGLHLAGIAAHVYADTFSHYGFSGYDSGWNNIDISSIEILNSKTSLIQELIDKAEVFREKHSRLKMLGHGLALTYPDQPFLKWKFRYSDDGPLPPERDNQATFLEACHKLYEFFIRFAEVRMGAGAFASKPFPEKEISNILAVHGDVNARSDLWREAMRSGELNGITECQEYWPQRWQAPKYAADIRSSDFYKFHCAADYHRAYVLRVLLPSEKYGIVAA